MFSASFVLHILTLGVLLLGLAGAGCSSSPAAKLVYQDRSSRVELRVDELANRGHSHPAKLTPAQVKDILDGVLVRPRREPVSGLILGEPEAVPAFTTGESYHLSTPISAALATASPAELVTFYRRVSDAQIGLGYTTGGIFVQNGLVYIVLANYRVKPSDGMVRDVPMYPFDPIETPLLSLGTAVPILSFVRPEAEVHPVDSIGRYDERRTLIVNPILAHRVPPAPPDAIPR